MKITKITCPYCGANVNLDPYNRIDYCTFCGAKLMLEDDGKTFTYNYNKTYRKIDEAEIKKYETEIEMARLSHEHEKDNDKQFFAIIIGMFVFSLIMYATIYGISSFSSWSNRKTAEKNYKQGLIQVGDAEDFKGKKYKGVVKKFKAYGFKHVKAVNLDDSYFVVNVLNHVSRVSIDGVDNFTKGDYFDPKTAKVIIEYH